MPQREDDEGDGDKRRVWVEVEEGSRRGGRSRRIEGVKVGAG